MEKQPNTAVLAARVPQTMKDLVTQIISMDTHLNESEFVREAIREKIIRDTPELHAKLFRSDRE